MRERERKRERERECVCMCESNRLICVYLCVCVCVCAHTHTQVLASLKPNSSDLFWSTQKQRLPSQGMSRWARHVCMYVCARVVFCV